MIADQHDRELADVMAEVARTLHEPESVDDVLGRLVRVARDAIPAEFVGVSIASPKGIRTAAASDPLVNNLDEAQYELSEGPCLDAMRLHTATAVADLRTDNRWPRFGPRAVAAGVISQMGIEIYRQHSTVGGLNLYASRPNAFDDDTRHAAALFARHAGLALDKSLTITNLTEALQTRQTIGQAIGIVMQRYTVDEAQAFRHLVRLSQTTNIKLRDIARSVVDDLAHHAMDNGKRPKIGKSLATGHGFAHHLAGVWDASNSYGQLAARPRTHSRAPRAEPRTEMCPCPASSRSSARGHRVASHCACERGTIRSSIPCMTSVGVPT